MARYTTLLVFLVISHLSFAQVVEESKFEKEKIIKVNKPKKEILPKDTLAETPKAVSSKTTPDTLKVIGDAGADVGEFILDREPSIVNESRLSRLLGDLQIVKVSEELKIDCVWVKAAEYYSVWDSRNINPYRRDASLFKDTVEIELYNIKRGELWSAPLEKTLQTSGFGFRWGRFHQAIDLNLRTGEPVFSVFDGIVRISGYDRWLGHHIVMRHLNGLETLYAHLSSRKVESGQGIKAGQLIGLGGST
ncbi:MAG: M23 family metallopeptidase, partial [Bacteroidota bacterium]